MNKIEKFFNENNIIKSFIRTDYLKVVNGTGWSYNRTYFEDVYLINYNNKEYYFTNKTSGRHEFNLIDKNTDESVVFSFSQQGFINRFIERFNLEYKKKYRKASTKKQLDYSHHYRKA